MPLTNRVLERRAGLHVVKEVNFCAMTVLSAPQSASVLVWVVLLQQIALSVLALATAVALQGHTVRGRVVGSTATRKVERKVI